MLFRSARRFERDFHPRDKRPRLVSAGRLARLGLDLMDCALQGQPRGCTSVALSYRDGLLIAFLISVPIRRHSLAAMRIETHLTLRGGRFHAEFSPQDMKSRQPFSMAIPQFLTPYIERFLSEIRPQIPGAEEHHWLWASSSGGGLCGQAIFKIVTDRTTAAFGHPVNPHLFRSIAATTIAVSTPGQVRQIGRAHV